VNLPVLIFLVLVCNQILATATFAAVYGTGSDWRASLIGRHLMFYTTAAGAIDLSWLLLLLFKQLWLMYLLFVAQAGLGALTWQRVYLVIRAQRGTSR
jgi:hypothetical protein